MSGWTVNHYLVREYINIVKKSLESQVVFNTFRNNNSYIPIVSEAMPGYEIDIYYGELLKRPKILSKLNIIKQMDNIGGPVINDKILTSTRNIRYMYNTARIKENFGDIKTVAEIGVGFGGLCFTMGQYFNLQGYKLLDIDCVIQLARLFLSKLPPIYKDIDEPSDYIEEEQFFNPKPPYDLCVSECALTELDDESIQQYYDNYLIKSKHLFIRTNFPPNQKYRLNKLINTIKVDFEVKMIKDFPHEDEPESLILGWKK